MPAGRTNLYERYELGEVLGKGGMGVVYRARDTLMDREVALKTLLDIDNPLTLELFYKECGVLAAMVHPNIVNVYDVGEFEDNGVKKPFFVMPLLPGATLDKLIKAPHPRFTPETLIEIIAQACRGLHAAHEMGLVHRDIKPSNIFVMDDNSVKIIDFGIARAASMGSMTSLKGTLSYMAPEQLQLKAPTALSDQYAMAVVCYEALTRRRPFQGNTETEVADAILRQTAPPISDLNPNVRYSVSQVVHKAMARQPFHRFPSVREFSDALTRAARAEPLEYFDAAKIRPRLERATAAFEQGDLEFASELLSELEGEGYLAQEITLLRRRLDRSLRQTRVRVLLESANRYAEAQEFPLALRKIQEALEIDPEHADALSMKNRVEKGRREKKIDEWIQLARQHIQNQAFSEAREALENALQLKPNETEALRLVAEVSRREDDITKTREKKAALYESAVQAWERGEVTHALGRLDHLLSLEREVPDADSSRSGTYQSFYNQVRNEHDSLKNSYEEARRQLAAEDFGGALAICKQYLSRYPNHALFQSLEFDIEERQRQKLSALIAETDRRVDQEPDLDVRIAILGEAARRYPQEKHFQSSLRLVEDKRDLVNSIVSKAQLYEERHQFNEALDQWQILRTIHGAYPGLDFEIERVKKNRDAQTLLAGKARYIETIDRHIETADYDRARQALEEATREFPNDPEFPELEKLIRKSQERTSQALELFNRARELGEANQVDECLALLRQAHETDLRNPVIRTVLINTLVERAVPLVNQDYAAAEPVLREVLDIEPGHAAAQSLLNQVADRRREGFVTQCVTEARQRQVEGDLEGALAEVRNGLATYPQERVLQQLQSTLRRAQGGPAEAAEETRPMPSATFGRKSQPEQIQPQVWNEEETAPINALPPSSSRPVTQDPTTELTADLFPVALAPVQAEPAPPPPPVEGLPEPPPPPPVSQPAGRQSAIPWKAAAATALAVISIIILAVLVLRARGKHDTARLPGEYKVTLRTSQPQATILIDDRPCGTGSCEINLAPGQHRAEARLNGYAPAFAALDVKPGLPGGPPPVTLTLTPRLTAVVISSNLNQATVALDQGPDQPLQNGEIQLTELPAGQRAIRFKGEGTEAVITLNAAPAAAPRLDLPIRRQSLNVTIVSGLGPQAKLFTTLPGAEASLDGKPAGRIESSGLDLTNLPPGSHDIVVTGAQGNPHRVVFDSGPVPSMAIFLGADRNLGVLRVTTGEDDVTVYINGEKTRRTAQKGRLILNLEPKSYRVRVEKEGFQAVPEQTLEIKKGEEARVDFQLVRLPSVGSLVVQKGPAGAQVLIDGVAAGSVGPDGTFSAGALKPGNHSVTVRKEPYKPLTREVNVTAGQQAELDATLQLATGTVRITIAPADVPATLSWKREGEEAAQTFSENPLSLPEGSYAIIGRAPDHDEARTTAKIVAGQQTAAVLIFRKIGAKKGLSKQGFTLADIEKSGGWTSENGSLTRTGGNIVTLPGGAAAGAYAFTAAMQKGKRLEWLVNYVDAKNYVGYELTGDSLARSEYVDGRKQNVAKTKLQMKLDQWVQVTIELRASSIVTNVQQPQGPSAIDRFVREGPSLMPGLSFLRGKFAFRIPGKDRMGLSAFIFTPQ